SAIERNVPVALPTLRMSIFSADRDANHRRPRTFPLVQEFLHLRRNERADFARPERAVDIQTKLVRRFEHFRAKVAGGMVKSSVAQPSSLAVPGKFGVAIR